jgi:hypothetical protein
VKGRVVGLSVGSGNRQTKPEGGGAASSTMRKEPTDGGSGTSMGAATASRGEPEQEDWVDVKRRVVPEPR